MISTMDPKLKRKKEKEEQERLEEAFEEFRETFEDSGETKKVVKTFIRGDVVNASKSVPSSPAVYKPSSIQLKSLSKPPPLEAAKKIAEETAKKIMMEAADKNSPKASSGQTSEPTMTVPPVSKPPKPSTKKVVEKPRLSNLEAFKEELKQMQAMRDERKGLRQHLKERLNMPEDELDRIAPSLDQPYGPSCSDPYGEDDPNTTNLYVCNLPADAKLEDFFDTFGTFGPLASARILYPRPEEERRYRETLSGFVAFMSRTDAERAKCAMHQETIRNCELRVSWARPVNMPPLPFYVPLPLRELAMPDPPSGLPFNARPQTEELRSFLQNYGDLPKLGVPLAEEEGERDTQMLEDYKKMIENATVRVVIPTERPLLALIHRVVEFLVRSGPLFEAILMARERQNPMYRFLFDNHHPTHVYYRWRLYTILQGDDRQKWRLDKFKMFEGGSWWQPPPHSLFEQGMPPQLYDTAYVPKRRRDKPYEKKDIAPRRRSRRRSGGISSEEEENRRVERRRNRMAREREREQRRKEMRGILGQTDRDQLEEMLRNLSPEKIAIGDAMIWCLEHAECAKEITQCIFESLCIKETPLHKKIARIYLVSDILANCAARIKDAFYFRQHFGDYLLKIFVELNETLEGIESRLKAEQFRQRVMLCFRNWEDNAIYPTDLLIQCQNLFLGLVKHGDNALDTSSIDGEPLASDDGEEMDIDGEPMADDGLEEKEDIDGIPLGERDDAEAEEDIDGMPMDEGEATAPRSDSAKPKLESDDRFTVESWNTVDIEADNTADNEANHPGASGKASENLDVKSKWESIDLHSRWERHEGVAREFMQQQREDEDGEHSPMRKKHKLTRLSPEHELSKSNGGSAVDFVTSATASTDDEERRRTLREIEVKVMKLQDQLETEAEMTPSEINAELTNYRHRLMEKLDEKSKNKERKRGVDTREHSGKGRERERRHESEKERDREGRGRRHDSLNTQNKREERNRNTSREKRRERSREKEGHRDRSTEKERDRERRRERDKEEAGMKPTRSRSPGERRRR